jgi:hypothetical protein
MYQVIYKLHTFQHSIIMQFTVQNDETNGRHELARRDTLKKMSLFTSLAANVNSKNRFCRFQ